MATPTFANAFLIDLDNPSIGVEFQGLPDDWSLEKGANWEDITILGRSEPVKSYGSSGARTFSLTLFFRVTSDPEVDLLPQVRFLEAVNYANYDQGVDRPPVLLFGWGSWISTRVVSKITSQKFMGPWTLRDLYPTAAEVTLSLEETNVKPFGYTEVRLGRNKTTGRTNVDVSRVRGSRSDSFVRPNPVTNRVSRG